MYSFLILIHYDFLILYQKSNFCGKEHIIFSLSSFFKSSNRSSNKALYYFLNLCQLSKNSIINIF
jgi:hypothetical protein